jgi:hypothetical protein
MHKTRYVYRIFVGIHLLRNPLGRPRKRCGYTELDLKEMGCRLNSSAQNRVQWMRALVNAAVKLRVP